MGVPHANSQGWLGCLGSEASGSSTHPQSRLAQVPGKRSQWETLMLTVWVVSGAWEARPVGAQCADGQGWLGCPGSMASGSPMHLAQVPRRCGQYKPCTPASGAQELWPAGTHMPTVRAGLSALETTATTVLWESHTDS